MNPADPRPHSLFEELQGLVEGDPDLDGVLAVPDATPPVNLTVPPSPRSGVPAQDGHSHKPTRAPGRHGESTQIAVSDDSPPEDASAPEGSCPS